MLSPLEKLQEILGFGDGFEGEEGRENLGILGRNPRNGRAREKFGERGCSCIWEIMRRERE